VTAASGSAATNALVSMTLMTFDKQSNGRRIEVVTIALDCLPIFFKNPLQYYMTLLTVFS